MSRFYDSSKDSLTLMHERYFKYMVILGIPMGVGITLLADKIMLLLGGSGYIQSIIALQILIWTMVLTFIGASFVQLLQSINKQLIITKISIICVIFNIALNLVIIPKYSYIGASVVTVLTEILLVGYIIWTSYKLGYGIHFKVVVDSVSKTLFATLIMSVLIWYLKDLNLFILIILATLLYFITLYLIKGVDDKDILIVKEILNKNK